MTKQLHLPFEDVKLIGQDVIDQMKAHAVEHGYKLSYRKRGMKQYITVSHSTYQKPGKTRWFCALMLEKHCPFYRVTSGGGDEYTIRINP